LGGFVWEETPPKSHGKTNKKLNGTVDGQNPAPPRLMIIPLFDRFLTIQGGAGCLPSTV